MPPPGGGRRGRPGGWCSWSTASRNTSAGMTPSPASWRSTASPSWATTTWATAGTARNPSEFGWFADRDGWKHVVKDVRALRERVGAEYPGLPCFLLGHSMGSFVVRGYLMFWPGTVDGAILSGTGQEPPATVAAGRALSACSSASRGPGPTAPWLDALSVGQVQRPV